MQNKKLFIALISIIIICAIAGLVIFFYAHFGAKGEAPAVKLEIYDGPDYSESDNMCYYRVEAIFSGTPEPEIKFNEDDNIDLLADDKAEVGVEAGDSYTLVATATNPAGTATASITLSGECGKEVTEEEAETEEEEKETEKKIEEKPEEKEKEEVSGTAPTIALEIYEGPTPADSLCYYRVKATVTGTPAPAVTWSKDDSHGAWGTKKAQVNLRSPGETYTLTATATNSVGSATASISLNWGCPVPVEEHTVNINPSDIGWVESSGSGVVTTNVSVGDSNIDTDGRGFFAFDVSSLAGKEIVSATLKLKDPLYYSTCNFKGDLQIYFVDFIPGGLTPSDYFDIPYHGPISFDWDEDPLKYSDDYLKSAISNRADSGRKIQFAITYADPHTGGAPGVAEGRTYDRSDIVLTVVYTD